MPSCINQRRSKRLLIESGRLERQDAAKSAKIKRQEHKVQQVCASKPIPVEGDEECEVDESEEEYTQQRQVNQRRSKRLLGESRRLERQEAATSAKTKRQQHKVQQVCPSTPIAVEGDEESEVDESEGGYTQQHERDIVTNYQVLRCRGQVGYQNRNYLKEMEEEVNLKCSTETSQIHSSPVTQNNHPNYDRIGKGDGLLKDPRNESSYVAMPCQQKICECENHWKKKYMEMKSETNDRISTHRCEIYSDGKQINRSRKMQLEILVKNVMFPRQKFIALTELQDLTNKFSIGNKLMDKMYIPHSERSKTWSNYAMVAKKHLREIRSAKTQTMKREFMKRGEYINILITNFYNKYNSP